MAMYPDPNTTPTQPDTTEPLAPPNPPVRPYVASYERERYVQPAQPGVAPVARPSAAPSAWYALRATQVVYLVFGVIEAIILIRFVLKLLAANPDAAFTSFMYQVSGPFVAPFLGVFPTPTTQGSVFELSSLLAIIVYMLIAALIVRVIWLARRRNTRVA
jgi:uncharacterized protein YggT (Ycf19 family)